MDKEKLPLVAANIAMLLMIQSYSLDYSYALSQSYENLNFQIVLSDEIPSDSGPTKALPWLNNREFLMAQNNNDTQVLIAGFCAVLNNPLPGEEYNVRLAANSIKGLTVEKDQVFSQNKMVGPYTKERGYKDGASFAGGAIVETEGGGVCKIATTLYNLAILSDLDIVERHNHSMPVNYVPYGQDATVAYGHKDFKFRNTSNHRILIWSEMVGNRLYIGFYGKESGPEIRWHHNIQDITKPQTQYIINNELEEGEERIILNGMDGARVKSYVEIIRDDNEVEKKDLGTSFYFPLPRIIERGH